MPPERVRDINVGRHVAVGSLHAAAFGAMTPFCSCSSVPPWIGFAAAGVPLGVRSTFLIAGPLIDEIGARPDGGLRDRGAPRDGRYGAVDRRGGAAVASTWNGGSIRS
jgi:hypothetical protein